MKTKHTKKIFPLLFAILMAIVIIPFSAITAFAESESLTVTSIEIEALRPADGVEAKIDEIRIKSVNGDTSLADQVSFRANKLFWAEVPNLDPSTWGGNWSTFTGTFEEGKIYSLHFVLQSEVALASNCAVTISTPDGEVWWSGNIASQDATYVVGDAVIELEAFVINSIELDTNFPLYDELPTIKSVNGNEEYKDYVTLSTIFESAWYVAEDPGTAIDDPNSLYWGKIDGSIDEEEYPWLALQTHFMSQGGATLAENCEITLNVFEREIASTELKSEAALNYADIYFVPIVLDPNDVLGFPLCSYVAFGEDLVIDFVENPFPRPGFCGVAFTPDATEGEMQLTIPSVKQSYTLYACYGEVSTTIKSIEITSTVEIAPVTGGEVIWDDEAFTVAKINGEDAPDGIFDSFDIYWLFSDTFGYNDKYIDFEEDTFAGGFYYCLDIDVYLFAPYAETVEITLKTPTQTYVADVFSGEDYAYAYFSFDKTEGEQLKKYGDTVVTLDGFEVGAKAADITVTVVGEGIDYIGEYGAGYDLLDIEADNYLVENDVIEAGKLYALDLYLLGKEGYCIIDFSQNYENVTLNGFSPDRAYYEKNDEGEFVFTQFTLPMLGDTLKNVTAPTMSLNGYELGCDISDLLLNFESEGLFVWPEYDEDYWAYEISGNGDATVNSCESFEFVLYMWLNDGYTSDGITKDMFILNGIEPTAIYNKVVHFGDGTIEPCVIAWYKLPVFHEYTSEWYNDSTNHWNECDCTEKVNVSSHEDDDNDGKCDICTYKMYDIQYIYDGFDLRLEGYKIGNPTKASIDGTYIDTPEDVHYFVFDHKVFKYDALSDDWVACADTDVFLAGARYMVDVTLWAETGYELRPSEVVGDLYDVTLNGIVGIKDTLGFTGYSFYLPPLVESGEKCPEGEIVINGYVEGNDVVDLSLGLPDGYTSGAYGVGFMLEGIESDEVLDNTGIYRLICALSLPANYDFNTFSKETLTVFGCEPDAVAFVPIPSAVMLQLIYTLPDAPKTSDVGIDKIELTLNGYKIGASTDDVWYTPNESAEYVSEFSQFVLGADSYDEYIGNIVEGQKYYYMISIEAKHGYTLTSLRREDVTLNGMAPVNSFYEDGIFLCLIYELNTSGETDTPGGTDTPDDSNKKDGLGAGAIIAIVVGSMALFVLGGFAIFWFVIKKKTFAELIFAIKALWTKFLSFFKESR